MKPIIEVAAAVILHDQRILAAQRGTGAFKGLWEFPGGKIEAGESPEAALTREIKEELDLDIEVGELFHLVQYEYESFILYMQCFICTPKNERMQLREHSAAAWLLKRELNFLDWLPADVEVVRLILEGSD